jgi:Tfp pilus assembly protein PilN
MTAKWKSLYRINLVRDLREQERIAERRHRRAVTLGIACFGMLALSLLYCAFSIWEMEHVIAAEKEKLEHLRQEYRKYTATNTTVDKADVELLNSLQQRGIFWTAKLGAMAKHLPDNYWITKFQFGAGQLHVSGFGYPSPKQEQLLILDDYLKKLRADSSFSDAFKSIHLDVASRSEEVGAAKVAFEFTATTDKIGGAK